LWLDHFLDAFEMGSKTFAWARGTFRLAFACAIDLALDCRKARLDFLKGKRYLVVINAEAQPLGTGAVLGTLQNLQDRSQVRNPFVGALLGRFQPGDLLCGGN